MGSIVKYHINSYQKTLLFGYQMSDTEMHYQTKPMEFIDQLVNSKHEGGLYSYLVSKGLAINVDSGSFLEGNGAFSFYLIQIEL